MVTAGKGKGRERWTMPRRRMNGKRDGVVDGTEMALRSWCSRKGNICRKRRWRQPSEEVSSGRDGHRAQRLFRADSTSVEVSEPSKDESSESLERYKTPVPTK